ncbi:hypothetical protein CPC16_004819 [Podila verticillata]|nr:hypothetical protein BGZ52_002768 [Haplosporangium bisporale]KAF9202440.1 hypothetical protein BGZ59_002170 [Podila verticillata]KAF9390796.1 hypothetical protein CPC16_004819 [Podila verticillata]KAI9233389.1 MAG: peptidyl-prolyl cis-trans isomerase ssp-1 [Podila humilis]KFH71684.1 peptidyl-prolyl cis-trans isomerase NIMA-interacting 1 [Podila verticillata NRRL 6337]
MSSSVQYNPTDYNLPKDWELRWSRSRSLPYFYNRATSESRWQAPEGVDPGVIIAFQNQHEKQQQAQSKDAHADNNPDAPRSIRVSHLLVKHAESRRPSSWREATITRSKDAALERLEGFQSKIQSGEAQLGELAATESDCSSAKKSGDLGFFEHGQMQPSFEKASFALKVGEMSGPIWTDSGVHLIVRTG